MTLPKTIIVSATKTNTETFKNTALYKSIGKLSNDNLKSHIYYENTLGLSEVYNDAIKQFKDNYDFIIFCHDDVFICDAFVNEKLQDGFEKYDFKIMGIAGSRSISLESQVIAWHTGNNPKTDWSGAVAHPIDEKRLYVNSYGPFFEPVLTLDGLFIACHTSIFSDPSVCFDNQFEFDFYDMDFCVNAFGRKIKLGTVDIFVEHASQGNGLQDPKYLNTQKKFITKWKVVSKDT